MPSFKSLVSLLLLLFPMEHSLPSENPQGTPQELFMAKQPPRTAVRLVDPDRDEMVAEELQILATLQFELLESGKMTWPQEESQKIAEMLDDPHLSIVYTGKILQRDGLPGCYALDSFTILCHRNGWYDGNDSRSPYEIAQAFLRELKKVHQNRQGWGGKRLCCSRSGSQPLTFELNPENFTPERIETLSTFLREYERFDEPVFAEE